MGIAYSRGAAYGWRGRIGMLQPGLVSDTNPFEFYMMAPQGVELVLTSLQLGGMSNESYERAIANLETPVQRVIGRDVDAIIQTGIPPLVTQGWGIEDSLRERVAKLTSVPYITDAAASIKAMQALGISRIVVTSGFDDELVELIRTYMRNAGIEVVAHERLPNRANLEAVYRVSRRLYQANSSAAEGIWITMASIPSVGVIEDLERDLGVPVVTSAQALMWAGLHLAGIHTPVAGFGRLFDAAWTGYAAPSPRVLDSAANRA
jgi:maleate isomerase